jgi:hypothetical protein
MTYFHSQLLKSQSRGVTVRERHGTTCSSRGKVAIDAPLHARGISRLDKDFLGEEVLLVQDICDSSAVRTKWEREREEGDQSEVALNH